MDPTGKNAMSLVNARPIHALLALAMGLAPGVVAAATPAAEPDPRVAANEIAPASVALRGPNHRVLSPVQVTGYMGQFTVRTDWGDVPASGGAILAIRVSEVRALAKLEEISRTEVFADAVAAAARNTGQTIQRVVTQPVETVKGIPGGVERLFQRSVRSARNLANTVSDAVQPSDGDRGQGQAGDTSQGNQVADFAREFAGVNRARRDIARALGIDPYTGNPLIQKRLEELAYASMAGGLSFGLALGQVGGFAKDVISVTDDLDDLVWDASPADIREQLEARLVARGIESRLARSFLRTSAFSPSIQLEFVAALEALGRPQGEADVLTLATTVRSEVHARFLVNQLRMLKRDGFGDDPVTALVALDQSIAATTRRGRWIVTLPLDRLTWNGAIASFAAETRDLPRVRKLVVSGGVSERSRRELTRAGFTVVSGAGLP